MGNVFQIVMLISFGLAWPMNIYKSYVSQTTKGKSIGFSILVVCGYIAGLIGKIINSRYITNKSDIIIYLYIVNITMIAIDILLYFRNMRIDRRKEF